MKVIIGKNNISARSVNDRAIEHSIAEKTTLSKKNERELTGRTERSVTHADNKANPTEQRGNTVPNRPPNAQSKQSGKLQTAQLQNNPTAPSVKSEKTVTHADGKKLQTAHSTNTPTATSQKSNLPKQSIGTQRENSVSLEKKQHLPRNQLMPSADKKSAKTAQLGKIPNGKVKTIPFRPPKQYKLSPNQPKGRKFKVLKNGIVDNGGLTKKKERVIYNQQQKKQQLQTSVQRKIDKGVTKPSEYKGRVIYRQKPIKLKKLKLKRLKNRKFKVDRKQADLMQMAMGGGSIGSSGGKLKKLVPMGVSGAKKVSNIAKKPAEMVKQQLYSKCDNNDTGTSTAKAGLQAAEYVERGVKTAVKTGVKGVQKGAKLTKRVYRKLHKPTSAELKRTLRKKMLRNKLKTQVDYLARQAVRNGTKAAGKATVNAAKTTAKAAAKAAQAASKAVANAVSKVASLIAETMPYSLIVIGVILIVLVICLCMSEVIGGAGGSVAGGGAWLVDDNSSQTPEEIYEGYKEFIEQAKDVMETQAKDALKNQVTSFCDSDTTTPHKIIQYIDKNNNRTFYPAKGNDTTINALIDEFGTEDYADYMSLLFVLMTREKQQADGTSDGEIYDFDFEKEDFEEFMKTVNENSCRWGDTFVIKTAVETSPEACPGENCKTKYLSDRCASYEDEDGHTHYYCAGHDYCPINHTKLTVKLYTVKDYYNKDYPEIYNFTENEKARYEASKAIIQGLLDYWE